MNSSAFQVPGFKQGRFFVVLFLCLTWNSELGTRNLFAEVQTVMPYYKFTFSEGLSIPSKGDFFANHEVGSQVGSLWNITDKAHLFGLYDLTYEGPGLMRSEGRLFSERAIRHSFMTEPSYDFSLGTLRLKGFLIDEKRRSGTNEIWGQGLYDYSAVGGSIGFDRKFLGFTFFPSIRYTNMEFPNFTDLLREFQTSGQSSEIAAGGLMDQTALAYTLSVTKRPFNVAVSLTNQEYKNEKVVTSAGTYSDEPQVDSIAEIRGEWEGSLWRFSLVPAGAIRFKRSNQNYLYYESVGDTSPDFIAQNFNYNELNMGAKLFMRLTKTKAIFGAMDLTDRLYTSRPPRNSSGVYQYGEQQNTTWGSTGGGLQWKVTDYSTWNLAYYIITSASNMKYESFVPYNYTGHIFGLWFTVTP
ncbi:MAG: hypothetical protein HY547_05950 [Elusimicrobia bacterium]|nr:hypothetical protein [Elusimicrobiota bacterium]